MGHMTVKDYICEKKRNETYIVSKQVGAMWSVSMVLTVSAALIYCKDCFLLQVILIGIGLTSLVTSFLSMVLSAAMCQSAVCIYGVTVLLVYPVLIANSIMLGSVVEGLIVSLCFLRLLGSLSVEYYKDVYQLQKAVTLNDVLYIPRIARVFKQEKEDRESLRTGSNVLGMILQISSIAMMVVLMSSNSGSLGALSASCFPASMVAMCKLPFRVYMYRKRREYSIVQ